MQKVAVLLLLFAFVVLCGFQTQLQSITRSSHDEQTTVVKRSHVQLMTPENDPALFTETFCDLQGTKWYPGSWQQRTPYFLLAGAKKSGTTSLSLYLTEHSNIKLPRTKELRFFLPKNFQFVNDNGKTKVGETRQYMYENDYNGVIPRLKEDESLLSFEATPGYIFHSTTSPKQILCTAPWVKILLILRNPVDRAWSNYNFYLSHGVGLPPFEEWIEQDMDLLKRNGVLNKTVDFAGSDQEYIAWDSYLKLVGEGPLGRSMYAIQIQHWYDAMRAIGRDPTKDIFIVRNEDLKRDPQATLDRIFSWLGVPKQEALEITQEFMVSQYVHRIMANETREMLQEFYRPYNERLYEMLGGDWQGVWEKPIDTSAFESSNNVTKIYAGSNPIIPKERPSGPWYTKEETLPAVKDPFIYGKASHNASAAAAFVNRWCELKGVNWYPDKNDDAWHLRAPYLLIPGAKKSGTTSLAFYLVQHPKVARARTKELQFFMNKNFRDKYVRDSDRKTLVKEARQAYEREFHKPRLQNDPSLISMDATPGYLFFSSMLPQRILCTVPWVKLLIILRNPVDRVYSNYQYVVWRSEGKFRAPFEKFIETDITLLRHSGVLVEDGVSLTTEQEDEAWSKYLGVTGEGPVGRSLYVIQLRQWFQAIRDVGRSPETQIHVVRTEDINKNLDGEYRKIEDFLGLPHSPIKSVEPKVVNKYESMKNETRAMLEKLLDPFNKRLYDMLGGDWDGYWDP